MVESRTDLLLNAKTRGFEQATQQTARLGKESKRAMSDTKREVERLDGNLQKLAKSQADLNRQMEGMEKGSKAFKAVGKELKGVQAEANRTERTMRSLERAFASSARQAKAAAQEQAAAAAQPGRGAFTQGFAQGATGVDYFQRGQPGAMRQAAGIGTGRALRGVAGGLGSTPFAGAGGIVQALQSIPGIGGALAAPLQQSMQQAQQALSYKQIQQQTMPFLGGTRLQGMMRRARAGVAMPTRGLGLATAPVTDADIDQRMGRAVEARDLMARGGGGGLLGTGGIGIQSMAQASQDVQGTGDRSSVRAQIRKERGQAAERAFQDSRKEARRQRSAAAAAASQGFLGDITGQGAKFGFAAPEARQLAAGVSQAGGGTGRAMAQQGMVSRMFGAQRLGMGADVSGAFLQGGRRGGVVGGLGRAGGAMEEAIREGMRMGLEGSELTEFMSQMAGDIRSWQQTGMPVNPKSVAALGAAVGGMGVGGLRGSKIAMGLSGAAKGLSTRGPSNAAEFAMLQEFGGFQGGGAEAVEAAQLRLQEGKFGKEDMTRLFQRMMGAGGGGATGRATFRRALGGMGVQVGIRESQLIEKRAMGLKLSKEDVKVQEKLDREARRGAAAAGNLNLQSAAGVDPALTRQARITNQQINTGKTMIKSMQNLEGSASNVAASFSSLVEGPLSAFTGAVSGLTGELKQATTEAKAFTESGVLGMASGGGR